MRTQLSVISRCQSPALGQGQAGRYLHGVVVCSRCQPLPVGAEPETTHGLAVPLRRRQNTRLTLGAWPQGLPSLRPTPSLPCASWGAGYEGKT